MKKVKLQRKVENNKEKKDKTTVNIVKFRKIIAKLCIFLIAILSVVLVINIRKTYALFESEISGTTDVEIANWVIEVNNQNVTSGTTQEFDLTNFQIEEKVNVLPGKIAPGIVASAEINIVPKDLDVSAEYEINIDTTNLEENMNFTFTSNLSGGRILEQISDSKYIGTILLKDQFPNMTDKLKVNLEWVNNEDYNDSDTVLAKDTLATISIPITVNFKQIAE